MTETPAASFGRLCLSPLTDADAKEILEWRYAGELAVYGFYTADPAVREAELRDLLDPLNAYHSARSPEGELVGFCCFGRDAQVPGGDYGQPALDVGLGLRPDLVGRGLGGALLEAILAFARRTFDPPRFRLTVATFNRRALTVYGRAGFEAVARFERPPSGAHGSSTEFLVMVREAPVDKLNSSEAHGGRDTT